MLGLCVDILVIVKANLLHSYIASCIFSKNQDLVYHLSLPAVSIKNKKIQKEYGLTHIGDSPFKDLFLKTETGTALR